MVDKETLFSQLPESQQELALQHFHLIQPFLEGHVPLTQIVRAHHLSLRTARRWVQHYRADGLAGLVRSVRADRGTRRGMPPGMEQFIQELIQQEREAPVASLYRRVLQAATEHGWPTLSYSQIYAITRSIRALPRAEQAGSRLSTGPLTQQLSLLEAKLRQPRLPTNLVRRERLFAQLDEGSLCTLTLLSAPAGFGKTTLVCQWMAEQRVNCQLPPIAWVSLDAEDNDPLRFWRYVMAACQRLQADSATPALDMLHIVAQSPFVSSSSLEAALTILLNIFIDTPGGILVLEDYHVIVEPQIHQSMAFLLDHLPASLHIFLITRADPPLSLAKLRFSDNLREVRTVDLRFSLQEIQLFLQQATSFPLAEDVIKHLNTRLDGWAAGLRLLSTFLQQQSSPQDVEHLLASFTGSHRPLQAYFVSEVVSLQPESTQDFLLRTSILGRLTASLCDTLTGRDDSYQMLEALERTGLFLEVLDEKAEWYRYHALFREALGSEARRRLGEATIHLLASRASQWFEQHEMLSQAIEMAFLSGHMTRTVVLIECFIAVSRYKELHEYHTLFRWLKQIPMVTFKQSPALCLSYAMTLLITSPIDRLDPQTMTQVKELLSEAESGFKQGANQLVPGELFALHALLYWRQEDVQQAVNNARQALALMPENEVLWRGFAEHVLGVEALFNGQLLLARRTFQKTRALGQRLFTQTTTALPAWHWGKGLFTQTVTVLLAWTCFQQGELHLAAEYYHQVLTETRESGEGHARVHALLGLARIAYEWNDLDEAERLAKEASLLGRHLADAVNQVRAELLIARVLLARGATESARKLLVKLPARMHLHPLPPLEQEILAEQARQHLVLDDIAIVQRWAAERARQPQEELPRFQYEQEALLLARLHLTQNQNREALTNLQHLLEETPESEHSRIGLKIHVLLALAEAANHQGTQARQRIQTVLSLAQTEGYQRLFLDEGEAMERLLRSVAPHLQGASLKIYLQQLLLAFGPARTDLAASSLVEPLSPQELRVLRELSTGSPAPQIAQHLVVSVTTVRTQIQSIYRKLQVNNRVAACEAARGLHLL